MTGDYIESSPYDVRMLVKENCRVLCKQELTKEERDLIASLIDDSYVVNMQADNLPVAMRGKIEGVGGNDQFLSLGFPVGYTGKKSHMLHNHLAFVFLYHRHKASSGDESLRVVGFEVVPQSIKHAVNGDKPDCGADRTPHLLEESGTVYFTYDVSWEESPIRWVTRWDTYLQTGDTQIHWFSIINSLMIVLFLSGMMGTILLRTLLRDIARYNEMDNLEEAQDESGWKLVHGDVFRRPNFSKLLAVCSGTGIQILGMTVVTMFCAALGLLSPSNRGGLLQAMLLLFTFMGFPAGFVSARLNKLFQGEETSRSLNVTLMTALQFPGVCFSIFFLLNLFIWSLGSSGAVPFSTMFLLLVMWFGISLPLVFVGSYFGYKKNVIDTPVRTNQIPRQIPPQHWLTHPVFGCLIGGVLPFGAVFTELLFILSSMWQHQFYYLFGFLTLVLIILVITCAEISIAFTYFQLAAEDYRWWWRSYWCSASSAIYVFVYSIVYFYTRLQIHKFVSCIIYFSYMFIISYGFFLLTGAIGFFSTLMFVRAIYGSIKID